VSDKQDLHRTRAAPPDASTARIVDTVQPRWPNRFPDLVVVGQEDWGPVKRRNQLLLEALARRNPHARFLFSEQALRPRQLRGWRPPRPHQVARNVWTLRTLRPAPDSLSSRLSDSAEGLQIRRAAEHLGLEEPMLWSQNPRAAALVDGLPVSGIIYDLTDDWAAFEADPDRRAQVEAQIDFLTRRADLVLACSRWLETQARQRTEHVIYLPNAVDSQDAGSVTHPDLDRLPSPRLGYVGTLHSARIDVPLVAQVAERRPDWSFIFVGPNLLSTPDSAALFGLPNVHDLGTRPHYEIQAYVAGLDVCLMPNRVTDFTRSLDPLKLYEYLAAGRPVIATPAGIPAELAEGVITVTTADELIQKARQVLEEDGPDRVAARRALVAGATWDARALSIEDALQLTSPPPATADVSVVIVNFNTKDLLERCLTALYEQTGSVLQTIVVDNASIDGSRDLVRGRFREVELLELPENVGFARANNLAFTRCTGKYVLLLNSDAFLHQGALHEMIAVAERHPTAAAVGPRLVNPDGSLQRSAWPFPQGGRILLEAFGLHRVLRRLGLLEDFGVWDHGEERPVDFLIGACLLFRTETLLEVSGFDESFWLYGEEADLQRRLRSRGWSTIFSPDAVATHVGAASSTDPIPRLRQFYAGQKRFLEKHGSPAAWPMARFALFAGSLLRRRWAAARVAARLS
jgi:teichuronic acid biosynthesis glycosyltransferase TuaH